MSVLHQREGDGGDQRSPGEGQRSLSSASLDPSSPPPERRLLICDDELPIARIVGVVASKLGFEVELCVDAGEVEQRIADFAPTAIALDLRMPGMDGIEVIRMVAAQGSRAAISLLSGADPRTIGAATRLCKELGIATGPPIAKPFSLTDLRSSLTLLGEAVDQRAPAGQPWNTPSSAELRAALESDSIGVHHQPKVDLTNGSVWGSEALLRWERPGQGFVPPPMVIELAEESGLLDRLTETVLRRAIQEASAWPTLAQPLKLAVNLPPSLGRLDLPDRIESILDECNMSAERLVLEVTEQGAMADSKACMDILTRMRLKGFRLSIDDFGTGSSSLVRLYRLPFDELKVDRMFVKEALRDPEAATIVRSTIALAQNMGLSVVAEGIEDRDTLDWIVEQGCNLGQGYLLGRPMPNAAFEDYLRERG